MHSRKYLILQCITCLPCWCQYTRNLLIIFFLSFRDLQLLSREDAGIPPLQGQGQLGWGLWPTCGRCPRPWQGLGTKWCLRSLPFDVFQKYLSCKLPKVLNQALWQHVIPTARTDEFPPTSGSAAPSALIHHVWNPAVLLKHLWCAANSLVWNKKI